MIIRNKSIVGIEMDSKEIRAVELCGTQEKPTVINWGKIELPDGIVKEGRVSDKQLFPVYLNKLFRENGFKSKDVILGVNNQDIIVRFAMFPNVPRDKIKNMIKFQAKEYIPVPLEEIELDYVVLEEKNSESEDHINVVLVGARKKMLNDFIEVFTNARLTIRDIDSTMLALGRSALIESDDGTFVLAGFNNDIGNILVFSNGILSVARSVTIPYSNESTKQKMEKVAEVLIAEIKSSVGYHKMQKNENIDKVFVMGNCEEQEIVADIIKETTGFTVMTPTPYISLNYKAHKGESETLHVPDYYASISLAIRGLGEK